MGKKKKHANHDSGLHFERNVSTSERIISVLSGSWLLYNALFRKEKSVTKALTGGYLLFRGATGYCIGYNLGQGSLLSKGVDLVTHPVKTVKDAIA
ncbi:MAG: DUF2892 domain-containing protein [Chitinophagales bacterium]|nr:DUF2892 domain-containing protein [Chitinophagales bacterium]